MLEAEKHDSPLGQGLENLFCKGPDSIFFFFFVGVGYRVSVGTIQLCSCSLKAAICKGKSEAVWLH